jgi:3-deoxy-D-manno-octulosonate 8-phosphate phosphatase (KDO 8-P phosphatase)
MVSGLRVLTPSERALSPAELRSRARRLRLVLTDCDGVLTDATVWYSERGEELKRFSLRDGMGVELLRRSGIETAIVTRERSGPVRRRAEKLGVALFEGVRDKEAELPRLLEASERAAEEVAYIGDDVNDLGILGVIAGEGLTAAPADAVEVVAARAHLQCRSRGGDGAFREFADWILRLRGGESETRGRRS